jgi:integrase
MSVRKRVWSTQAGPQREAWVVDYMDQQGKRRLKTFKKKGEADQFAATTTVQISEGVHVADSASITVKDAAENWIVSCRSALERGTLDQYQQHVNLHIVPLIGREKLSKVTVPFVRGFEDKLRDKGTSPAMIRAVRVSLGALLGDAQERGFVVRNAAREFSGKRGKRGQRQERRKKGKLKVGIDIPTPDEVRALLAKSTGSFRPFLLTAVFTGLRASELRGLLWRDVDLRRNELHVRQRADRYNTMGKPKSEAGERTIPLTPGLAQTLREWKLKCPKKDGQLWLVFPNGEGNVEAHANIVTRQLSPTMVLAGITKPVLDEQGKQKRDKDGEPIVVAKYTGLHALRHFFASWCINRKVDGGLELPAKVVQERLGHASIAMTLDVYGHLFPRGDDAAELAAGEKLLLG